MRLLPYYLYDHSFLALAQTGLTIWMLVDAYRRQADQFWFWVILLFQPFGPWFYFFAIKSRDFRNIGGGFTFQRKASLDELRYQANKVPTLTNHLALGERLIEKQQHGEAALHLQKALNLEPEHCQVLYGLALCSSAQGHPGQALPYLDRILDRDRRWSDYAAFRLRIAARSQSGDCQGALSAARELARIAPSLHHQCILAELLVEEGLKDEARALLQQSLETHHFAPGPSRRRNRAWARQARRLSKQL